MTLFTVQFIPCKVLLYHFRQILKVPFWDTPFSYESKVTYARFSVVLADPPVGSSATSSIIGAIIGILIVGALIATGLLLYCRRRNRSENGE